MPEAVRVHGLVAVDCCVVRVLCGEVSYQVAGYAGSWCAVVDGEGVCTVSGVEFLHQIIDVAPDCLVTEAELEGDLFIRVAFCYVPDDLELSLC